MKNITYINAGAGSGKTYHLISRFTDLVASGQAKPEEVIMTTFSERAAAEIKERAKAALIAKGLVKESLGVDHAAIGTVHSIAYRFVRKYWFRLGLAPDIKVMDDDARKVYVSQSLSHLPSADELRSLHDFAREFNLTDKNSKLVDYNGWRRQLLSIIGLSSSYEVDDFSTSISRSLQFADSLFNPYACCGIAEDDLVRALDSLRSFWEALDKTSEVDKVNELRSGVKKRDLCWYKGFANLKSGYRRKKVEPWVADVIAEAASVRRSVYARTKVEAYIKLIFNLAGRWRTCYSQFKAQKNVLDYEDMEKFMLRLLSDPVVAADAADSFKFLFVDEYQDCSPIQVKIFDRLSELVTRSYWVGDVKQAIYAFRGSATELTYAVMQKVSRGGDGCSVETLGTSWRSLPPIVDVCNKLFSKVYGGVIPVSDIVLEPHRDADLSFEPCLRYWDMSRCSNKGEVAARIASQVADLVANNGVNPKDIALLARSNADLASLAAALRAVGLPVCLAEQEVNGLAATDLLLAFLAVVVSPGDLLAKATIVYLTEKGRTLESIMNGKVQWDASDDGEFPYDYLELDGLVGEVTDERTRSRYMGLSVSNLVETMTIELGLFDEVKKMENPDNQTSCLHSLILAARTFEDACLQNGVPATIPAFIDFVRDSDIKCGGDRDGVQLVTFHGAKGLQWPYVVLTSLDEDAMADDKLIEREVFGIHKDYVEQPTPDNVYPEVLIRFCPWLFGNDRKVRDEFISAAIVSSDVYARACECLRKQEANLLYVGMTRPSDVLILTAGKAKDPFLWINGVASGAAALRPDGDILGTGVPFADCSLPESVSSIFISDGKAGSRPRMASFKVDEHADYAPLRNVSPSEVEGLGDVVRSEVVSGRITLSGDGGRMSEVGNCIHHIFSLANECPDAELDSLAATIVDNYGLCGVIPNPSLISQAWRNLVRKLTELYGPAKSVFHERPFSASLNGFCVTGAMDLLWVTDQGDVLVDFKSCPLAPDVVLDPEDAHFAGLYAGQLDCYASALAAAGDAVVAKLIFYPVSGLLVELADSDVPVLSDGLDCQSIALKPDMHNLHNVSFNIVCEDFDLKKVLACAANEEHGQINLVSASLTSYAVNDVSDDDLDDDDEYDDDYLSSPADEDEFDGNFKFLAYVRGKSAQGVYIARNGKSVELVVYCFSSPGDCSLAFNILVAIKRNFFPADIFLEGEKLTIDSDDLSTWLFEKTVNNFAYMLGHEGKVDFLFVQGLKRRYYLGSDYLKTVESQIPSLPLVAATDFADMQWKYADYRKADVKEMVNKQGYSFDFTVLRNDKTGVVIDMCEAVVLMLHGTPIYATASDFFAITDSDPHVHRLDSVQYAVDPMSPDEWESLCLSVACHGNSRPSTCLLLWNSAMGDAEDNPARRYLSSSHSQFSFSWNVGRHVDAKLGDIVYFVDVSSKGGILLKGEIICGPYAERESPKGKYSYFVDTWIRSVGRNGEPLIPIGRLRKLLPDVAFDGKTSFVKLDSESATRLRESLPKLHGE